MQDAVGQKNLGAGVRGRRWRVVPLPGSVWCAALGAPRTSHLQLGARKNAELASRENEARGWFWPPGSRRTRARGACGAQGASGATLGARVGDRQETCLFSAAPDRLLPRHHCGRVRCAPAFKLLRRNRSGYSFCRRVGLGSGRGMALDRTIAARVLAHNPSTDLGMQ